MAATKCEQVHQTPLREAEALIQTLLKNSHFIETSSFEDINVDSSFFTLAHLIRRGSKTRCKIMPFAQASQLKQQQLTDARVGYQTLLNETISDFQTTWPQGQKLLEDKVTFQHFVQLQGIDKSKYLFFQQIAKLKDGKKQLKRSEHLTRINKALAALLPNLKEDSTWLECQEEMKSLKEFDRHFVILDEDSLWEDEDWLASSDPRIPSSILGLPEAEMCFDVHKSKVLGRQRRLEMEHYCRDMIKKSKDVILPGGMMWTQMDRKADRQSYRQCRTTTVHYSNTSLV